MCGIMEVDITKLLQSTYNVASTTNLWFSHVINATINHIITFTIHIFKTKVGRKLME